MSKSMVFCCLAFLIISTVLAQESACKPPGFVCTTDADCCAPFACNPWAGRCTKKIVVPPGSLSGAKIVEGSNNEFPAQEPSCKPPGFVCAADSDCCAPFACNPWAGRCTKKIVVPPRSVGGSKSIKV